MLLSTDRCNISPLTREHEKCIHALYTNASVRKHLGGIISEESFPSKFRDDILNGTLASLGVNLKDGNVFIGLIIIDRHHDEEHQEISYQFKPEFWGKGLAKECILAVLEYARTVLKLNEIVAETQTRNRNSTRLLEKLGMTPIKSLQRFGQEQTIYYKELA